MSSKVLEQFHQQEAGHIALSVQLHRWSRVLIALMVREQEQKLLASDLPVEEEPAGSDLAVADNFWEDLG